MILVLFVLGCVFFVLDALNVPAGRIKFLPLALMCWFLIANSGLIGAR
jgi:hypothetical protein